MAVSLKQVASQRLMGRIAPILRIEFETEDPALQRMTLNDAVQELSSLLEDVDITQVLELLSSHDDILREWIRTVMADHVVEP